MTDEKGISLGELACRLERDKGGLSRLAKKGRIPRNDDGTYDFDAVVDALRANTDPAKSKPLPGAVDSSAAVNSDREAREAVTLVQRILEEEGRTPPGIHVAARNLLPSLGPAPGPLRPRH